MQTDGDNRFVRADAGEAYLDPERPGVVRVPVATARMAGMEAIIDEADWPLVKGKRWNWSLGTGQPLKNGSVVWAIAGSKRPTLGRLILGEENTDLLICHLNGDRLDCRRANLVARTRSESAKLKKPSEATLARLRPYPDPERAGVWRVPLKGYRTRREALVDEADLHIVEGKNWNWGPRSGGYGDGAVLLATMGRQTPLSRMILGLTSIRERVRHINGNALDCTRANLAVMTTWEQAQSARKMGLVNGRTYTSQYKGVSRDLERGKWKAQISFDNVHRQLGRFDTELEAVKAYDAAARVRFGRTAYLNFPDEPSTEAELAAARVALAGDLERVRAGRLRQRRIEQALRRAAAETDFVATNTGAEMISEETARQLFDIIPTVWRRWRAFGWVPASTGEAESPMQDLAVIERLLGACGLCALPYPDPQRPGVYRVPLNGETGAGREALIDADAAPLVRPHRWRFAEAKKGRGGEITTMDPRENIRLHYVVMGRTADTSCHIGHRNDDPFDCRRENVVVRSFSDTSANHRKQATFAGEPCTSRFKGVCKPKKSKRWIASIKKDGVQRRLGTFHDEMAAAQAYDEAAKELFGEHARLNFPDGVDAWLEKEYATQEEESKEQRVAA